MSSVQFTLDNGETETTAEMADLPGTGLAFRLCLKLGYIVHVSRFIYYMKLCAHQTDIVKLHIHRGRKNVHIFVIL